MYQDRALRAAAAAPARLYVDGRWRDTERTFAVEDPGTGTVLAEVADASVQDALAALSAAASAQESWAATSPRERADLLRSLFDAIHQWVDEFADLITAEMGKPVAESRGEVAYAAEFLRWFSEQAAHRHGSYGPAPRGGSRIVTTRRPVGPSLLITPWNFPLAMVTRKLGAAMAAGCTSVLKPAPQTPLTSLLLAEVAERIGLPAGVFNVVPTTRAAEVSAALMGDPRLRKVSFTGSTPVGRTLLRQSGEHVLRSSLELGGNGPFLVFDDADLDAAVEGAMAAKFRNGGQSCVAANRFLVHRDVIDDFTDRLVERVRKLSVGHGFDGASTLGPLIDSRQCAKVAGLVEAAVSEGAVAVTGETAPRGEDGYFHPPTVLADVAPDAAILRQEIFGPVAPVTAFDTDEQALRLANSTEHGLAAYLYTRDLHRAVDLGERLEAGMVGINRGMVSEPAAPFGGIKESGLGREGGAEGIEEYLETTYLAVDLAAAGAGR
ncbi:NAD-dependent succinate-semialdehyde dehydrogenase [Saccharopolyspora erythraea]|uniref:NAD-dependent succinate-semialdehyde dehydrogenase n=1 Tax=Saccharopolyspora erythraea TaxID=1836 RepID=UPI001BACFA9B|nr:NAD-dependent succinate-semialdehyde dehydrogenase [Saccharopolyspora erythraea]QUH03857.1 NAD-dependent succinate-semialdehyde dehydrogenase [Saccharopolyspora erythraea]